MKCNRPNPGSVCKGLILPRYRKGVPPLYRCNVCRFVHEDYRQDEYVPRWSK